jgi:hypothetical protein
VRGAGVPGAGARVPLWLILSSAACSSSVDLARSAAFGGKPAGTPRAEVGSNLRVSLSRTLSCAVAGSSVDLALTKGSIKRAQPKAMMVIIAPVRSG